MEFPARNRIRGWHAQLEAFVTHPSRDSSICYWAVVLAWIRHDRTVGIPAAKPSISLLHSPCLGDLRCVANSFGTGQQYGGIVLVNLAFVGLGGNWAQRVDISRQILEFAKATPDKSILVDDWTFGEIRMCNALVVPENVIGWSTLADESPDYILEHKERPERPLSPDYVRYLKAHSGTQVHSVPPAYRSLFLAAGKWLPERSPFVRSRGAVVYEHR